MADPAVVIRAEQPSDFDAIATVVEAAFKSPVEARLVEAIRASVQYVAEWSLVAELGDEIVGHVMISFATLVNGETRHEIAMLSPLAVAPSQHGRGIGSDLVRAATGRADAAGEPLVILEGSPHFYGRLGFEYALPLGIVIPLPSWAPSEAGQVMRLRAYDASLRGDVAYTPEFDAFTDD